MSNATSQGQPPTSEAPASPAQPPASASQPPKPDPKTGDTTRAGEPTQPAARSTANTPPPAASSAPPPAAPTAQPPTEKSNPPAPTPPPESKKDPPPPPPPPPTSSPQGEPKSTPTQPPAAPPPSSQSTGPPPPAPAPTTSSDPPPPQQQQPGAASSSSSSSSSSVVTVTNSNTATSIQVVTSTTTQQPAPGASSGASSSTSSPTPINAPDGTSSSGLSQKSKVALGVSLPLAFIIMLAVAGLLWWKKRKARLEAEEERRKEVEDYAYNPNADPTMPAVGLGADHGYDMREDSSGGYRGWGSTTVAGSAGSAGRKQSTTMSGGMAGGHSDAASPTLANGSGEPLLDGSSSPEGEILGVMGPSAASNRAGDVRRGPSNASSSYSAAARSEGSDGAMYGNGAAYYEQCGQNPYGDQRPQELPGQAVIRDNPARRNTRIENSSHYPQQSAGIAQNF